MKKIGFFEEAPGSKSMTRLILFLTVLNAAILADTIVIASMWMSGTKDLGTAIASAIGVFTGMTTAVFTVKLLQKGKENEGNNRESGEGITEQTGGITE